MTEKSTTVVFGNTFGGGVWRSGGKLQPCIPDLYMYDGVGPSGIATLVAAGDPWNGVILQAVNGITPASTWFPGMWKAAGRSGAAAPVYGTQKWLRGAYGFFLAAYDPIVQADLLLSTVDAAGGWDDNDLWPCVDVEVAHGNPAVGSPGAAGIIEAGIEAYAHRILTKIGKRPVLYAGSYTRDLGITSRMGCSLLWMPEWDSTLDINLAIRMGWDLNSLLFWQVTGNAPCKVPGYPVTTPIGLQDYSVMVRANLPADQGMAWTLSHNGPRPV